MIKSIGIENFQSHKSTFVEFAPGLNIICGSSDKGKSTLVRAIEWVWKNRPSGDEVRNWYCEKKESTTVEISLQDSDGEITITKERTGSGKVVYSSSKAPEPFAAVGTSVPQEIIDAFNLSSFNVQAQHDAYLLIGKPSGYVAKLLNDLVGLSVIDTAFKNLNSDTKKTKEKCVEGEKDIERLGEQIDALSYVDAMLVDIEEAERAENEFQQNEIKITTLSSAIATIIDLQEKTAEIEAIIQVEDDPDVSALRAAINDIARLDSCISSLNVTILGVKELAARLAESEDWLTCEGPAAELGVITKAFKEEDRQYSALSLAINNLKSIDVTASEKKLSTAQLKMKNYLTANPICPTCNREYDEETVARMVE